MREIYFHIGAHKSASTTIQDNLRLNKGLLFESVDLIAVVASDYPRSDFFRFFLELSSGAIDVNDSHGFQSALDRARVSFDEIISSLSPGAPIFFSYEGFMGYCRLHEYKTLYPHSRYAFMAIKAIAVNYSVKILFVVRRQSSYIESCYMQQIKVGRVLDFNTYFASLNLSGFSWLRIANEASEIFGSENIKILPFELISYKGVFEFICEIIYFLVGKDVSALPFELADKANESLSGKGLELCLAAYPLLDDVRDRKKLREFIAKQFPVGKYGKPRLMSAEQVDEVMGFCAVTNAELFERYIVGSPNILIYERYWVGR
jgi:hypothetical protein